MLQHQYLVATFVCECSERRWSEPADDVGFADGMSVPDEAAILSDVLLDALSDSFDVDVEYDVAP
jgi:hypothetical protein